MRFSHPALLLFGALAIPLAGLFLIRRQRTRTQDAYLFLWRSVLSSSGGAARAQLEWLRLAWPLAIIAVWTVALAGPQTGERSGPHRQLLVIDNSASMQAGQRLPTALRAALGWVRESTRSTVVVTAPHPQVLLRDGRPEATRAALRRIRPSGKTGDFEELEAFLSADRVRYAERMLFSDGCGPGFDRLARVREQNLRWVRCVAGGSNNLALREVAVRPLRTKLGWRVAATVVNLGTQQARSTLRLGPQQRSLTLAPGQTRPVEFTLDAGVVGPVRIALAGGDALSLDDEAELVFAPWPRATITLASPGKPNPFWRSALKALGEWVDAASSRIVVTREWPPARSLAPVRGFEVVILDGVALRQRPLPTGRYIVFSVAGPLPAGKPRRNIGVWQRNRTHPIMRNVSLSELLVRSGRAIRTEGDGLTALAHCSDGALIVASRTAGRDLVAFGFGLADSNLPGLIAFPLLLRNILLWFSEELRRVRIHAFAHPAESRLVAPEGGQTAARPGPIAAPLVQYRNALGWISAAMLLVGLLAPPLWASRR